MKSKQLEVIKTRDSIFVVLEGREIKSVTDFYKALEVSLAFPEYFGRNLDALYDVLTDLSWLIYENVYVIVKDADTFFSTFPEMRQEMVEIFQAADLEQLENKHVKLFLSDLHDF